MSSRLGRAVRRPLVAVALSLSVVTLAGVGAHAALTDSGTTSTDTTSTDTTSSGQSQDSHAIVVNHGDNRYRYAITLKIVQVGGAVVDPQNAAVAVAANCTDCETVAISMEGVLVYGDPTVFAPTNLALAYNENCTNCATLAAAYQEIVPNDQRVRISGEGRQIIASVRVDLESIRHEDLTLDEIDARVNADAGRLLDVLNNDVFPVGPPTSAAPGAVTPSDSSTGTTPSDSTTTPASDSPTTSDPSTTDSTSTSPADSSTSSDRSTPSPTASASS
jgi:hypothetical protein